MTDPQVLAARLHDTAQMKTQFPEWLLQELEQAADCLRELARDKQLLDWLADPANVIGSVQLPRACVEGNLHSMRDAIAQARSLDMAGRHGYAGRA